MPFLIWRATSSDDKFRSRTIQWTLKWIFLVWRSGRQSALTSKIAEDRVRPNKQLRATQKENKLSILGVTWVKAFNAAMVWYLEKSKLFFYIYSGTSMTINSALKAALYVKILYVYDNSRFVWPWQIYRTYGFNI